jgi:phosphoribosylglycinamide formyltransferase 2
LIVPEIEAIRTEVLLEVEQEGYEVIPSARAANLTMNRDRIRDVAVGLGVRTAKFSYAESADELLAQVQSHRISSGHQTRDEFFGQRTKRCQISS